MVIILTNKSFLSYTIATPTPIIIDSLFKSINDFWEHFQSVGGVLKLGRKSTNDGSEL